MLRHGEPGLAYNIPGSAEHTNVAVVEALLDALGKPRSLIRHVEDRPGHDRRYAMTGDRLAMLGWSNRVDFETGLRRTVDWFTANADWWRAIRSGEFEDYYERQYGQRLARAGG